MSEETSKPPPNPHYRREYCMPIRGGHVWLTIPAPGGNVSPENVTQICKWLDLVKEQLTEESQPPKETP